MYQTQNKASIINKINRIYYMDIFKTRCKIVTSLVCKQEETMVCLSQFEEVLITYISPFSIKKNMAISIDLRQHNMVRHIFLLHFQRKTFLTKLFRKVQAKYNHGNANQDLDDQLSILCVDFFTLLITQDDFVIFFLSKNIY